MKAMLTLFGLPGVLGREKALARASGNADRSRPTLSETGISECGTGRRDQSDVGPLTKTIFLGICADENDADLR